MAMLRNLRNMIKAGVSERHHRWVLKKLTDEGAVIHSRQFPFRLFSAYEVFDELENAFDKNRKEHRNNQPGTWLFVVMYVASSLSLWLSLRKTSKLFLVCDEYVKPLLQDFSCCLGLVSRKAALIAPDRDQT